MHFIFHHKIQCFNQMTRVIVMDTAKSDHFFDQSVGIYGDVGAWTYQTSNHVSAANSNHLNAKRERVSNAAYLDDSIRSLGFAV